MQRVITGKYIRNKTEVGLEFKTMPVGTVFLIVNQTTTIPNMEAGFLDAYVLEIYSGTPKAERYVWLGPLDWFIFDLL